MNELHDTQAIAARLTARILHGLGAWWGYFPECYQCRADGGHSAAGVSPLVLCPRHAEQKLDTLLAHVETLTQQVAKLTAQAETDKAIIRTQAAYIESYKAQGEAALIRAEQSEQQRAAAHAALKQIVDESDSACGCDHTDENCCVLQGGGCAFCTAAIALDAALAASAPQQEGA